jgi:hypothetical protein
VGLSAQYSHVYIVTTHLTSKYDIHFNFFLTKPITEMVYNHTCAPSTIAFKDAAVLADCNEYLKRYYFLRNSLDKEEIYERINLLAGTSLPPRVLRECCAAAIRVPADGADPHQVHLPEEAKAHEEDTGGGGVQ